MLNENFPGLRELSLTLIVLRSGWMTDKLARTGLWGGADHSPEMKLIGTRGI